HAKTCEYHSLSATYPIYTQVTGGPVPISGIIGHQGRIHPGRSANPSQGPHTHSHNPHNLEMPNNLPHKSLDWGRKLEYPEETPEAQGGTCKLHTYGRGRESNPQPWRCEANMLTTKPPLNTG
ncbi:hypothetical protein QTP86_017449, partial [Hemibagrus guttatus]